MGALWVIWEILTFHWRNINKPDRTIKNALIFAKTTIKS